LPLELQDTRTTMRRNIDAADVAAAERQRFAFFGIDFTTPEEEESCPQDGKSWDGVGKEEH
jgi:hypothetical protein